MPARDLGNDARVSTAEIPRPEQPHGLSAFGAAPGPTAAPIRSAPFAPLRTPPAPLRNGPLRCPSCELGLVVFEILGDLRFRCEHCTLEWRYGLGRLWSVGDGLGDLIP